MIVSWKTINQILGLACIDPEFWQALQKDPVTTIRAQGFELTTHEQKVVAEAASLNLPEFCQHLLERLAPDYQP
jgi:hypothetical protein